jgi:hypothetical protein
MRTCVRTNAAIQVVRGDPVISSMPVHALMQDIVQPGERYVEAMFKASTRRPARRLARAIAAGASRYLPGFAGVRPEADSLPGPILRVANNPKVSTPARTEDSDAKPNPHVTASLPTCPIVKTPTSINADSSTIHM